MEKGAWKKILEECTTDNGDLDTPQFANFLIKNDLSIKHVPGDVLIKLADMNTIHHQENYLVIEEVIRRLQGN